MHTALRTSVLAALLPLTLHAQPAEPAALPRGVSLFIGSGWSTLSGPPSQGGGFGSGLIGVAYERPWRGRLTWRAELAAIDARADLGETGLLGSPTTLHDQRWLLGIGARRYFARSRYLGAGATLSRTNWCWLDQEGVGIGLTSTASTDCDEFTDAAVSQDGSALGSSLTAGLGRGRWVAELRYDHGFTRTVRVNDEALSPRSVNATIQYRFGRRATPGAEPNVGRRARAPLPGQMAAGMAGWGLGAIAGVALGAGLAEDGDWAAPLLVGIGGAMVGTTVGVHLFGRRHGLRANPLLTLGGAMLGTYGGPVMPYTMPLGAVAAYNATSRER